MYDENDYLDYSLLNSFEEEVALFFNNYSYLISETYTKKEWQKSEFVFVDDIKNIEDAIEILGSAFNYPSGWQTSRVWDVDSKENISYKDLNRWRNNLDLLNDYVLKIEYKYLTEYYLGEEISL